MFHYIEELSVTEAGELKKTIKDLLKQTCILQVKCDPVTLVQHNNPRYKICLDHREFIEDYLQVFDCELYFDSQEHIFRIIGEGMNTEKLNERESRLLMILRFIYKDKIMGEGLNATVTTKEEIRKFGKDTNLLNCKLSEQDWREAFTLMKTHQILELPCAIGDIEDKTPLYIYSTINMYCSSFAINEIVNEYREEVEKMTMEQEVKEEEIETVEEDIY
ncbi:MAG: DUF4194 domain-containing protein [Lachnospiraceae bacterium]